MSQEVKDNTNLDAALVVHKKSDASYNGNATDVEMNDTIVAKDTDTLVRHRFKKDKTNKSKGKYFVLLGVFVVIAILCGLYFSGSFAPDNEDVTTTTQPTTTEPTSAQSTTTTTTQPTTTEPTTTTTQPTTTEPTTAPVEIPTTTQPATNNTTTKKGDANGDGKVSVADARKLVVAIAKGNTSDLLEIGDVNGDNKISVADARKLVVAIAKNDFNF